MGSPPSPAGTRTAHIAGWLMASTFVTSIGALILYDPVLNDTRTLCSSRKAGPSGLVRR